MDSSLKNKKFGVVHTSPSEMVSSNKLEVGKLYFAQGAASGAAKQGVYALTNMTDVDGVTTPQLTMFGTGAVADGTGYGLSQENFTTALKTALNNLSDIDVVTKDASGYAPKADAAAGTIDSQANDWVLAFDGSKVDWYKLPTNAFKNDNTTYNSGNVITIDANRNINHNVASGVTAGRYGDTGDTRSLAFGGTFKVVDTSVDTYGHVTAISTKTLTLPSKPATAGTADSANQVANSLKVQGDGTDIISFNGSTAKTINIIGGTNVSLTKDATNGKITINTTGVPTTTEMNTAIATALSSALQYCGTVASNNDVSTAATKTTKKKGDVYVASATFKPSSTYVNNWVDSSVEAGDLFIFDGSKFDIINGENQVSNKNATLTIGGSKTVATVDGTDITISLPSSGYYTHPASINGSTSVSSSDGGDFAFSSSNTSLQVITGALRDASGHISKLVYKDVTLPSTAYSDTKYTHPASITGTTAADSSLKSTTATTLGHAGTFTVATGVYRDASGHVSKVATETFKLPDAYSHPIAGTGTIDTPSNTSTATTLLTRVKIDSSGHVTDTSAFNGTVGGSTTPIYFNAGVPTALSYTIAKSVPSNAVFTDTKNTAGSTASTSKLYIIGATSQADNPQTYSNANVYIDGSCLYSDSKKVATTEDVEAATIYWETL